MLVELMGILRWMVGVITACAMFFYMSRYTRDTFSTKLSLSALVGIIVGVLFFNISQLPSEKKVAIANQKTIEVSERAEKVADKAEAAKVAEQSKMKVPVAKRNEAKESLQKAIDEGLIQKLEMLGEEVTAVWVEPKFQLLPYDYKAVICNWVVLAYFKDKHEFFDIVDGFSGNKIGRFTLYGGLKMNK